MIRLSMHIQIVADAKAMRAFVLFPRQLYRHDRCWAPPLWHEEKCSYIASNNVVLQANEHILYLAIHDGAVVGRILVFIDASHIAHTGELVGFFGSFECIEDIRVSLLLLDAAEAWIRGRGLSYMRGPINPIAESWGFLLEGYDSLPVLMAPYNPSYYHGMMHDAGMAKIKDLYAYEADTRSGYTIPDRIERFTSTLLSRKPDLSVRPLDPSRLLEDARHIWHITNTALANNWGYVPVELPVMQDMVKRLKPILDPQAIWFVQDAGLPVGYALGFPDPNAIFQAIHGRLLPFGFMVYLRRKGSIRRYRLFGLGVLPQYHGLGLDVLLYHSLYKALGPKEPLIEANYILEDNWNIRNALEKLGLRRTKTYRIYQKHLEGSPRQ